MAWGPDWELKGESLAIHGGWAGDPATTARAVPVYRTAPYLFRSTEEAANLFALAELGNICELGRRVTEQPPLDRRTQRRTDSPP